MSQTRRCACSQAFGLTHAFGCVLFGEVSERNFIEPGSRDDPYRKKPSVGPAQQPWVLDIPIMQQSVLFAAIRAPDGLRKDHPVKVLMRWYRRCVLNSAFDGGVLSDPFAPGGGSFTGPFDIQHAREIFHRARWPFEGGHALGTGLAFRRDPWHVFGETRKNYLRHVDEMPHHFQLHFMHAAQIIGVHHPADLIRTWWMNFYHMIVNDAHLTPETPEAMNLRLSDSEAGWRAREEVTAR